EIPKKHASDRGKAMVALHSQGAQHRATHRRGEVVPVNPTRNPNAATLAIRATPAHPGHGVVPTIPATPATPAVPAHKGGQSGNHRPELACRHVPASNEWGCGPTGPLLF